MFDDFDTTIQCEEYYNEEIGQEYFQDDAR